MAPYLNTAQLEILEMTSFVKSEGMLCQMKEAIASYFAKLVDSEIDNLWKDGVINENKIEEFRNLHQRRKYQ